MIASKLGRNMYLENATTEFKDEQNQKRLEPVGVILVVSVEGLVQDNSLRRTNGLNRGINSE